VPDSGHALLQTMIAVREAEMAQLSGRTRNEADGAPAMRMPAPSALRTSLDDANGTRFNLVDAH
jgi:hypothetical protein